MYQLLMEIWDRLYRSGPLIVEQIANSLRLDSVAVKATIVHELFETRDSQVRMAFGRAFNSSQGLSR